MVSTTGLMEENMKVGGTKESNTDLEPTSISLRNLLNMDFGSTVSV